ncbi:uncharacterized protein LOC143359500 [Halictus rubicundus]|uniref:uncharacterized protein LOC143359500 n=1 Tax=Halictus rubicundus TaxID=77578 RepID=UPI004035D79D
MGMIVPVMCITVWSLHVLTIALQHRHRIAGAIINAGLQSQAAVTKQRSTTSAPAVGRSSSATATVIELVSPLYVLYMPYCCLIIWEISGVYSRPQLLEHPELTSAASLLLGLSPLANGLLCAAKSQSLRLAVQRCWRKKMTRSQFRQVIN